ncbi:MAG: Gfo/Idh/MocA family oxidoreductase [Desulfobacteraceae bacterium]|jgi:predicted dehydrogenase
MSRLQFGIIGCGRIAQAHLDAISYFHDQAEVVALSDALPEKARKTGEKVGVDWYVQDYHELLVYPKVEAVLICLPHHLHYEATIAAAEAGKHILLEKPMALTTPEAEEMVAAARKSQITFMVGQSRRFSDAVLTIKKRLGEIGPIIRIVSNFLVHFPEPPTEWWKSEEQSGDLITYLQTSHSVDFCLWMIAQMPERLYARTFSRHPKGYGMKDEQDVILEFPGDATASLHLSLNTQPPVHEILVVGEKGSFRLVEYGLDRPFCFGNRLFLNGETLLDGEQKPSNYTLQMQEFVTAVRENREPMASGEEVYPEIQVLEAINASSRTGEVVRIMG